MFSAWTSAQGINRMHPCHPRAPALVRRPSSNNSNSNKGFRSINHSLSLASRQIYLCTPLHDTSQRRSCGCWRAVCTAGGARWRTTPEVQTPMHVNVLTLHNPWFWFPVALGFVKLHASVWSVSDLQASISRIHRTIELMYSDKSMMQVRSFLRSDSFLSSSEMTPECVHLVIDSAF